MKTLYTGNLIEDCKSALDANMAACAAHCNRLRSLLALAENIDAELFFKHAGQMPETVYGNLESADADFASAKLAYETFCRRQGLQAYMTYNED